MKFKENCFKLQTRVEAKQHDVTHAVWIIEIQVSTKCVCHL